jgi:hypothetical protein
VKLSHWKALLKEVEERDPMELSITGRKFSAVHLSDDGLTKMNVRIAFQVYICANYLRYCIKFRKNFCFTVFWKYSEICNEDFI